ncbi:MAG: hypothetical protein GXO26_01900 [Crenarchaeota archaeon]|nr:hypothetical protein [Thermoproteota archaeon]
MRVIEVRREGYRSRIYDPDTCIRGETYSEVSTLRYRIFRTDIEMHVARLDDVLREDVEKAIESGESAIDVLEGMLGVKVDKRDMKEIEDFINNIIEQLKKEGLTLDKKSENIVRELYKLIAYLIDSRVEERGGESGHDKRDTK